MFPEGGPFGGTRVTQDLIQLDQPSLVTAGEPAPLSQRVGDEADQECGVAAVPFLVAAVDQPHGSLQHERTKQIRDGDVSSSVAFDYRDGRGPAERLVAPFDLDGVLA